MKCYKHIYAAEFSVTNVVFCVHITEVIKKNCHCFTVKHSVQSPNGSPTFMLPDDSHFSSTHYIWFGRWLFKKQWVGQCMIMMIMILCRYRHKFNKMLKRFLSHQIKKVYISHTRPDHVCDMSVCPSFNN